MNTIMARGKSLRRISTSRLMAAISKASARIYFRTTSGRLTRTESLALAVVPQNPVRRSPLNGPDFEVARARMQMLADAEDAPGGGQGATASFGASGFALGRALPPLRVYGPARLPFGAPHVSSETLPLSRGAAALSAAAAALPPQPASRAQLRATAAVDKIIFARIFMDYSFFYGLSLPQGQTIVSLPYRPRKCKGADRTFAESSPEYFVQSAHQAAMDCRAAI